MNMWLTWANAITAVRIIATPFIGYYMFHGRWGVVLALASIAIVSDFFDGFIARALHQQSIFGAVLDHTADKVLMITMLTMVLVKQVPDLPAWFCWLVLSKEILLFCAAALLFAVGWVVTIAPLKIGKIAMAAQMLMLVWWLGAKALAVPFPVPVVWLVAGLEFLVIIAYVIRVGVLVDV